MTRVAPPARRGRDLSEGALAFWLLLPAFLLLTLVALYPVLRLLYTSLFRVNLVSSQAQPFVGLVNYLHALRDPRFWQTVRTTLLLTVITVPGALVVGLVLALLANLPYRIRWPVRLGLLLPWAMPLVFSGLVFRWFFNSQYGVINDLLTRIGLNPQLWLIRPNLAIFTISVAIIWKTSSFMALVILAGLQTLPKELYEAAQVDGARPAQQFWRITLPLLRPAIAVALIFRTVTALQTFDIPYAMTGGGPGNATETIAMYIRSTTLSYLNFGYGSALAALLFVVSLVVTLVYLRYLRAGQE